jgi:hypothetical protein
MLLTGRSPSAEEVAQAVDRHPDDVLHNFWGQDPWTNAPSSAALTQSAQSFRPIRPTAAAMSLRF